ncbi:MAG TPA: hypothetical protein VGI63_02155, partial [Verrucomicrobiae bacterium]
DHLKTCKIDLPAICYGHGTQQETIFTPKANPFFHHLFWRLDGRGVGGLALVFEPPARAYSLTVGVSRQIFFVFFARFAVNFAA